MHIQVFGKPPEGVWIYIDVNNKPRYFALGPNNVVVEQSSDTSRIGTSLHPTNATR